MKCVCNVKDIKISGCYYYSAKVHICDLMYIPCCCGIGRCKHAIGKHYNGIHNWLVPKVL